VCQFALDGQTPQFAYSLQSLINGFPTHLFLIIAFTLTVTYVIGYNLCCPPLIMLFRDEPPFKVRA
jgi:hypothetical protein